MSFPKKEERTKCWNSRDQYWQCLDSNAPKHSSTSGEDVPKACTELRNIFEKSCPKQWIIHFDRDRTYKQFKKKLEKGFDPIETNKSAAA